jgi:hypothetical protein
MIQRRALLFALPFTILAGCGRARAGQDPAATAGDMSGVSGQTLNELIGGVGKVAWLSLAGTVRLSAGNANVRPAKLTRAMRLSADGSSARLFDIWQIGDGQVIAGPSITIGAGQSETGPNDSGTQSVWLNRSFTHTAFKNPIEFSRLSPKGARVVAIDATQIWLVEGGLMASAPTLASDALAAYKAWQAI